MRRVGAASLAGLTPGRQKPPAKEGDLTTMLDPSLAPAPTVAPVPREPATAEPSPARDRWREVRSAIAGFFGRVPPESQPPRPDPRLARLQARRGTALDPLD